MLIFPAIDLIGGQAVRLTHGDYDQMTVYSPDPLSVARSFREQGARQIHLVDLEGARDGTTPHLDLILKIRKEAGLFCEVGGGIRSLAILEQYLEAGVDRAILGTAAVTDPAFRREAVRRYGEKIAVGVDIADGKVAIKGWREKSELDAFDFCRELQEEGVKTLICTDISRDGAMQGANRELYGRMQEELRLQIVASGGVSSLEDITALRALDLYGAIVGKAYYLGAIDLRAAVEAAK